MTPESLRIVLSDGRVIVGEGIGAADLPLILYHHGFPGSHVEARLAHAVFSELPARLWALSRPALGGSTLWPDLTPQVWGQEVFPVILNAAKVDRAHIMGVSGGTSFALACAAFCPDRVSSVTLVSPMCPFRSWADSAGMVWVNRSILAAFRWCPPLGYLIVGSIGILWRSAPGLSARWFEHFVDSVDRPILSRREVASVMQRNIIEALRDGPAGLLREVSTLATDWGSAWPAITCPVTIWHGGLDHYVPPATVEILQKLIPQSRAEIVRNGGHFMIVDLIERVLREIVASEGGSVGQPKRR